MLNKFGRHYRVAATSLGGGVLVSCLAFVVMGGNFGFENVPLTALVPGFFVGASATAIISIVIIRSRANILERLAAEQNLSAELKAEIAERVRAEARRRDSEARFRDFADVSADWFWETDASLRFTYLSPSVERILGVRPEWHYGKTRQDLLGDDYDRGVWDCHLADLQAHRPFRNFEYFRKGDDTVPSIWARTSGNPVFDAAGRFQGYRGSASDITEKKLAEEALVAAKEEAEAANLAKSQFLANVSHELRTPLNAINGFSELLSEEGFGPLGSEEYRKFARAINESGQHLLALISDVLDISKIEAGMAALDEETFDLISVIDACLMMCRQQAGEKGVALGVDIAESALPHLHADKTRIRQVLLNLLSNAVKFTEPDGRVTLKVWHRDGSSLVMQVIDTGIGIAAADIPKALARFQQVDSALNRKHQGTGLGLPLAKSLVEMHGGTLDLQSRVGCGTTVTVRLPAARSVPKAA